MSSSHRPLHLLFFLCLLAGAPQVCSGHAILLQSIPELRATVKGPSVEITLRFNVRIDSQRSRIALLAPNGTLATLVLDKNSAPAVLQTKAGGLTPGKYKIEWHVLAADGHMSGGEIPFNVN